MRNAKREDSEINALDTSLNIIASIYRDVPHSPAVDAACGDAINSAANVCGLSGFEKTMALAKAEEMTGLDLDSLPEWADFMGEMKTSPPRRKTP